MAGRPLVEWREDLIRDLGGNVNTEQDAIISPLAIKTKLLLNSIDVWLLQQPTLIIKRKKSRRPPLFPGNNLKLTDGYTAPRVRALNPDARLKGTADGQDLRL